MKIIYNLIKEQKSGNEAGKVVGSFESSGEANDALRVVKATDQSNDFNYFVATVQDNTELSINIDDIHPTIKE